LDGATKKDIAMLRVTEGLTLNRVKWKKTMHVSDPKKNGIKALLLLCHPPNINKTLGA